MRERSVFQKLPDDFDRVVLESGDLAGSATLLMLCGKPSLLAMSHPAWSIGTMAREPGATNDRDLGQMQRHRFGVAEG